MTDTLREGELTVEGRLANASNATLYCTASLGDSDTQAVTCVYKPIAGENPLWDFPDGTLAAREVAAYEVSAALGWDLVPTTVMRDGPYGPGMCQRWIDAEEDEPRVLAVLPENVAKADLDGWCPVMAVGLGDDGQGLLVHRDSEALRRIALFDAVINNADRKGGHLLPTGDGRVYAIDHGISFHTEDKLRTLLWGFAARRFSESEMSALKRLREDAALAARLTTLLTEQEIAAFHARIEALLAVGRFPGPEGRYRPVPWPLV